MSAAFTLLDETSVQPSEKEALVRVIPDLLRDTPATVVAASKWKSFLVGTGKAVVDGIQKIIVSMSTDDVKSKLGLPGK